MKLQSTLFFAALASAFAAEEPAPVDATPEQLRKGLKKRGLQASDGSDSGADTGGGSGCFSALNTVEVQGKGMVFMDDLKIGDYVKSCDGKEGDFSRVYSFAHLDRNIEYDFVQIHTEESKTPLELTYNHMVFLANKAVPVAEVSVGDMLGDKKVTKITASKSKGLYAPITYSGSIVVNNIKSSSYVALMDNVPVSQHHMTHMFFSLQRAACSINFDWCESETYTNGFSNYSNWAIGFYMHANGYSAPIQWLLTAVCAFVFSIWYAAEQFVVAPLLSVMLVGYVLYKAKTKKVKSA